jgi:hypothetical protein
VRIDVSDRFGRRATVATYNVTCLEVAGHQATIGGTGAVGNPPGLSRSVLFYIEDGVGGTRDRTADRLGQPVPPTCPPPPFDGTAIPTLPIVTGDVTVHDALAMPTQPWQCKNGGWHNFPQFKNQGQCIAFVNRGK